MNFEKKLTEVVDWHAKRGFFTHLGIFVVIIAAIWGAFTLFPQFALLHAGLSFLSLIQVIFVATAPRGKLEAKLIRLWKKYGTLRLIFIADVALAFFVGSLLVLRAQGEWNAGSVFVSALNGFGGGLFTFLIVMMFLPPKEV